VPTRMNEYVQQNLVGIMFELMTVDWEQVRNCRRAGAGPPLCQGAQGINNSPTTIDPHTAFARVYSCDSVPPNG
jgi:hypothetical protein